MAERAIGGSGIRAFPIGLGAMPLSGSRRPDEATAMEVIKAALDEGVTLIDTANAYCLDDRETGHNERLIAKALRKLGAERKVAVATKGGFTRPRGSWVADGRPDRIRAACEQSLRDLGVEAITLYQYHTPDSRVPFAEAVGAFARLREEGKVLHVGLSNVSAAQLREAQTIVPVVSVQNRLNPFDQGDLQRGMVDACAEAGVAYIAFSPVGGGHGYIQTGKDGLLTELGKKYRRSPYAVALAWLLGLGGHVLPIPGASKVASITDSCTAATFTLDPADARRIEAR